MTAAQSTPDPVSGEQGAAALRISGLAKSFGHTAAVSDIELTVRSGSFLGLVGPVTTGVKGAPIAARDIGVYARGPRQPGARARIVAASLRS